MALDKVALAIALKGGGGGGITVDGGLSIDSANPVENRIITAALGNKASITTAAVSLPTTGWTEDSTAGGGDTYPYYYDAVTADALATMTPIAVIAPADESTAFECGLCPGCTTGAGVTRFYAAAAPTSTIHVSLTYLY